MNWEFIVQKLSETSYHIAILLSVVSLLKLGILQWTAVKISSIKVSKILITETEKSATFSSPDEKDKIIQILQNSVDERSKKSFYEDAS